MCIKKNYFVFDFRTIIYGEGPVSVKNSTFFFTLPYLNISFCSPLQQASIDCLVEVEVELEVHVTLSVGGEHHLSPDVRHSRVLQPVEKVDVPGGGLTVPGVLAALRVGQLRPVAS